MQVIHFHKQITCFLYLVGGLLSFFPIKGALEQGTDLNTIGGAGIYNLGGSYIHAPFTQSWGNLIVLSDGSKTQIINVSSI